MKKIKRTIFIFIFLIMLSSCEINLQSPNSHKHNYVLESDKNTHFERCTSCDKIINQEEHLFGDWIVKTEPTYNLEGLKIRECSTCGAISSEIIEKLVHVHQFDSEFQYNEDYHYLQCECGEIKSQAAHSYSKWNVIKAASLYESGSKERSCSSCNYKQIEVIPMLIHTCEFSNEYKYTELKHYKECSCGAKEYGVHNYTYSNEIITENGISYLKNTCYCNHSIITELNQAISNNYGYNELKKLSSNYALFYVDLYNAISDFNNSNIDVEKTVSYYQIASVDYSKYNLSIDEASGIWSILYLENPQFYFISNTYTYSPTELNVCTYEDYINHNVRNNIKESINDMVVECSDYIKSTDNDVTKALKIHDFIINRIDYAYEPDGITPQDDPWAHSIVGVASKNGGVCEAYSKAYKYLCNIFGIESILVTGTSKGQNHAWNMIQLNDEWYHVDLTWDDQDITIYNYFAISQSQIEVDHMIRTSSTLSIDYLYPVPNTPAKSIELVTLYENDIEIGKYASIDEAFNDITNEESDYKIKLDLYKYIESERLLYTISKYEYSISQAFPKAKSIHIYALDLSYANGFNKITNIDILANNTLLSNLTLTNINLVTNSYVFSIANNDLVFNGYSGGITGDYIKTTGEIKMNTIR